jgi:hypothetical protein
MTSRWINPINNNLLHDLQNNILPSGSVAFYEAGTSTPLAVFSDPELTVSLGSYIDADAYGLLPDFHMAAGTQYKMVAYDAIGGAGGAGAVKWTRDDVFSADSSVDARLDAVEQVIDGIDTARNMIVNGAMAVAGSAAVTATDSFLETQVTSIFGKAESVSAGTMIQDLDDSFGSVGWALKFAGITCPNPSDYIEAQFRIPAGDAVRLSQRAGTFSVLVDHDIGIDVDFRVTVYHADALNDFSVLTAINASPDVSVETGTTTRLSLSTLDMGDCSNGVAIIVRALSGQITTKNVRMTEAQMEVGAVRSEFQTLGFQVSRAAIALEEVLEEIRSQGVPVLLHSASVTAVASIDLPAIFSANPEYAYFRISFAALDSVTPPTNDILGIRISRDGSAFDSSAGAYAYSEITQSSGADLAETRGQDTYMQLLSAPSVGARQFFGVIDFFNASDVPTFTWSVRQVSANSDGLCRNTTGTGSRRVVIEPATGFQIYFVGAATFAAQGTIKVYGSNAPF